MKINTALILCAGFGKRLNPITLNTPKPLLEIKDISMLERCINLIEKLGIQKIVINTFYLKDQFSEFLDKKNLISYDFSLEVSSPGIDRPLTRLKDFYKFKGNKVKITQIDLENKRTNYKGILTEVTEKNILLDQNDNLVSIKLDKICDAKLLV